MPFSVTVWPRRYAPVISQAGHKKWETCCHGRLCPADPPRAGARGSARRHARFLERPGSPRGIGGAAGGGRGTGGHPRPRVFDHSRSQSRRSCRRPLGRSSEQRRIARGAARHDDLARFRRPDGHGAAAGQDVVLHAAHGRRGGQLRVSQSAAAGRHEFPDLSSGGIADRRRSFSCRYDVADLFQRA